MASPPLQKSPWTLTPHTVVTEPPHITTLQLAKDLIARPSVTPEHAQCMRLVAQHLEPMGFVCEITQAGPTDAPVTNLWAKRPAVASANARTLAFAGHVDVVPPGPLEQWSSPPFTPTEREGKLYGRGASDMKTSIAAFIVATRDFLARQSHPALNIALLLTSDEEGPATDGTVEVCRQLQAQGQRLDWCIVGEPTAVQRTGDMLKNGRRGSLSGQLTVLGKQGHIAYPHLAHNPIHAAMSALHELCRHVWDQGNAFFPPTSFQISNIHAGNGTTNVIPGSMAVDFNFRFSAATTAEQLQSSVHAILDAHGQTHGFQYTLTWTLNGQPFLTQPGDLLDASIAAIEAECGITPELSTSGGTSDGRFIAQICPQVIELGPPNASIHQIDEHIALADIAPLTNVYRRIIENLDAIARKSSAAP